jgi:hypothetical protein
VTCRRQWYRRFLLAVGSGRVHGVVVLNWRRVDGEEHVDLAAEFLRHVCRHRDARPGGVGKCRILEIRRADAEDDLAPDVAIDLEPGAGTSSEGSRERSKADAGGRGRRGRDG